jgi:hypothetical protein
LREHPEVDVKNQEQLRIDAVHQREGEKKCGNCSDGDFVDVVDKRALYDSPRLVVMALKRVAYSTNKWCGFATIVVHCPVKYSRAEITHDN